MIPPKHRTQRLSVQNVNIVEREGTEPDQQCRPSNRPMHRASNNQQDSSNHFQNYDANVTGQRKRS